MKFFSPLSNTGGRCLGSRLAVRRQRSPRTETRHAALAIGAQAHSYASAVKAEESQGRLAARRFLFLGRSIDRSPEVGGRTQTDEIVSHGLI